MEQIRSGIQLSAHLFTLMIMWLPLVIRDTLFVAGDVEHGYGVEKRWHYCRNKVVKDINAGYNGSYPYSLFVYKQNVYFGAYDGFSFK